MNSRIHFILCILCLCLLVSGCGLFGKTQEKTAPELVQEGREAFKNEDYKDTLEAFQRLRSWYPFSQHAAEATLRIADAHYALEEYDEAAVVYTEFERLYPNDPETPRAAFQLAMCYFNRMDTVDRDQSSTQDALYLFLGLEEDYAGTPYADQAAEKIILCRESLAGAELYVANYYFRTKAYTAARDRIETLHSDYPETPQAKEATLLLEKVDSILIGEQEKP